MGAPDIGCRVRCDKRLVHKYPLDVGLFPRFRHNGGETRTILSARERVLYGRAANPPPPLARPALATCIRFAAALRRPRAGRGPSERPGARRASQARSAAEAGWRHAVPVGARRTRRQMRQGVPGMGVGERRDQAGHGPRVRSVRTHARYRRQGHRARVSRRLGGRGPGARPRVPASEHDGHHRPDGHVACRLLRRAARDLFS